MDINAAVGSGLGVSDEKILALGDYANSPHFSEAERLALEYADAMTLSDRDVDDELFERLRPHFDDDALVELTATIGGEQKLGGGAEFDVVQPHRRDHVLGSGRGATAADTTAAIEAARAAAPAWAAMDFALGPAGVLNVSVLQRFDSGTPYSEAFTAIARRDPASGTNDLGYARPPSTATYFVSERGANRWDDVTATDIALNYRLPIGPVQFFAEGEVINAMNEQAQIAGVTTISRIAGAGTAGSRSSETPSTPATRFWPSDTRPASRATVCQPPSASQYARPSGAASQPA